MSRSNQNQSQFWVESGVDFSSDMLYKLKDYNFAFSSAGTPYQRRDQPSKQ